MGWVIGFATLSPIDPDSVQLHEPTVGDDFSVNNGLPVVIADSLGAKSLRIEGSLWKAGYGVSDLEGTINTLGSYLKGTVAITASYTRCNGTWLMTNFQSDVRAEGGQAKISYSIEFKQGGSFLIL